MITFDIVLVCLITLLALYLFAKEILSVDTVAILTMVLLIVTGILTPEEGVSGFSNAATITVLCMFVLSAGIQKTGIVQRLGEKMLQLTKRSQTKHIAAISFVVGPLSGFINNTAAVAIMLPMVIKLAERTRTFASKLLMPLSFVSMAGGTLTLIGTSTNILANDIFVRMGFDSLGLFEFTKLGIIVLIATILYFLLLGKFLLPRRGAQRDLSDPHEKLTYNTETVVSPNSPLISKKVRNNELKTKFGIDILNIKRGLTTIRRNLNKQVIHEGDILLIHGSREDLMRANDSHLVDIKAYIDFPERGKTKYKIGKFMISGESRLVHRAINSELFRRRYQAVVLGLRRGNEIVKDHFEKVKLHFGDILLLRATAKAFESLKQRNEFMFVSEVTETYDKNKLFPALGIITLVVAFAAFGIFPIMVAALIGVILMFVFRIITPEEGYRAVNWEVILLLAGIIPLGIAIEKTGSAQLVADGIITTFQSFPPVIILGVFYLVTTILTQIISNNAAVTIIIPIAVTTALQLSLNPIAFVIVVMFAASTAFLTPIGYQTNMMVYSAGKYKFGDFIKVGLPLSMVLLFITVYFVNIFWGI